VTRRARRAAALAALALGLSVTSACGPVTHVWEGSVVRFTYGPSLPGGAWRDRVREASGNWAGLGLPPRQFAASPAGTWTSNPCTNLTRGLVNGIHRRALDGPGGLLASTATCMRTDRPALVNVDIVFDATEVWWVSDSSAISPNTIDLESVATHEMGHAWGWLGPHLSGSVCSPGPRRHTMCGSAPRGSVGLRSVERGDKNPVALAYGGPLS
jgi:hypothetical protein